MIKPQDILNKSLGPPRSAASPTWEERVEQIFKRHDHLRPAYERAKRQYDDLVKQQRDAAASRPALSTTSDLTDFAAAEIKAQTTLQVLPQVLEVARERLEQARRDYFTPIKKDLGRLYQEADASVKAAEQEAADERARIMNPAWEGRAYVRKKNEAALAEWNKAFQYFDRQRCEREWREQNVQWIEKTGDRP